MVLSICQQVFDIKNKSELESPFAGMPRKRGKGWSNARKRSDKEPLSGFCESCFVWVFHIEYA